MVCARCRVEVTLSSAGWVHAGIPDEYDGHEAHPVGEAEQAPAPEHEPTPSERQASALESIAASLVTLVTLVKRGIASG